MLSDERFADYVGVGKSSGRVREDVFEGEGFVDSDLEERRFWGWKVGDRGDWCV